jgi:ABC-2 type transport system permease protein
MSDSPVAKIASTGATTSTGTMMRDGMMPVGGRLLQPRRFGAVNWIGLLALTRRQMRNGLADYHYQILGPVVSSLLYLAVFHMALSTLQVGGAGDMLSFIAPGLVIYAACDKAYESSAASLILDKHERVIVDMLMAPLTAIERTVAYAVGAACSGLSVGLAVGLATVIFTPLHLANIAILLYFAIAGTLMQGLIGTLVGIWAQKWDQYAVIHTFLLLPLSFLSGVFYRVDTLPDFARQIIGLNPIFYVIDGFRRGMTGIGVSDLGSAAGIVLVVDLLLFLSVYLCFRRGYRLKP